VPEEVELDEQARALKKSAVDTDTASVAKRRRREGRRDTATGPELDSFIRLPSRKVRSPPRAREDAHDR
jgi:hypothetical protein